MLEEPRGRTRAHRDAEELHVRVTELSHGVLLKATRFKIVLVKCCYTIIDLWFIL